MSSLLVNAIAREAFWVTTMGCSLPVVEEEVWELRKLWFLLILVIKLAHMYSCK